MAPYYKDPYEGDEFPADNTTNATGFLWDHTFFGIRKGGQRLYQLEGLNVVRVHNLLTNGPDYANTLTFDSSIVTPRTRGLTNNKRNLVSIVWDLNSGADSLHYHDLDGTGIHNHRLSDSPVKVCRALCYLEHEYYVIRFIGEGGYGVYVYSSEGVYIRNWSLPSGTARGITTDGKHLYVTKIDAGSTSLWKLTVQGQLMRTYTFSVSADLLSLWPITFNGRYLIFNQTAA